MMVCVTQETRNGGVDPMIVFSQLIHGMRLWIDRHWYADLALSYDLSHEMADLSS